MMKSPGSASRVRLLSLTASSTKDAWLRDFKREMSF